MHQPQWTKLVLFWSREVGQKDKVAYEEKKEKRLMAAKGEKSKQRMTVCIDDVVQD
jgi:hypothetical protein